MNFKSIFTKVKVKLFMDILIYLLKVILIGLATYVIFEKYIMEDDLDSMPGICAFLSFPLLLIYTVLNIFAITHWLLALTFSGFIKTLKALKCAILWVFF